jgi:hypothetical protein
MIAIHHIGNLTEDPVEYFVSQLDRLLYGEACGYDSNIDLLLSGETYARDQARTDVNQTSVRARDIGIGVEHANQYSELKAKTKRIQGTVRFWNPTAHPSLFDHVFLKRFKNVRLSKPPPLIFLCVEVSHRRKKLLFYNQDWVGLCLLIY